MVGRNLGHWTKVDCVGCGAGGAFTIQTWQRLPALSCSTEATIPPARLIYTVCARVQITTNDQICELAIRIYQDSFKSVYKNVLTYYFLHESYLPQETVCLNISCRYKKIKEKMIDRQQASNGYIILDWQSAAPRSGLCFYI